MSANRLMVVILTLLVLRPSAARAQTEAEATRLLHEAMSVEMVQGDLERAISLYDEVVRRFPNLRTIASEALFRMARCRELLGDPLAEVHYRRLVREFPDAPVLVRIAQSRLAAMDNRQEGSGKTPFGSVPIPALEAVESLPWWMLVTDIHPDGTHLAYVDARTGDLNVYDPAESRHIPITSQAGLLPGGPGSHAITACFDSNGDQLAYNWKDRHGRVSIHVVGFPPASRPMTSWQPDYAYSHPLQLLSDGTLLLCVSERGDTDYLLVLSDPRTGQTRVRNVIYAGPVLSAILRPGSEKVIFDAAQEPREHYSDVFGSISTQSGQVRVIGSPAHDFLLGWSEELDGAFVQSFQAPLPAIYFVPTPDNAARWSFGSLLLHLDERLVPFGFVNDRSIHALSYEGVEGIWFLEELWGLPASYVSRWEELRATEEFGRSMPYRRPLPLAAHSREGTLLWALRNRSHTLGVHDLTERERPTRTIQVFSGPDIQVRWSPEGRYLAYHVPATPYNWPGSGPSLFVYDVVREEREGWHLPLGTEGNLLGWAPDGQRILFGLSSTPGERLVEVEPGRKSLIPSGFETTIILEEADFVTEDTLVGISRSQDGEHQEIVSLSTGGDAPVTLYATEHRLFLIRAVGSGGEAAWIEYEPPGPVRPVRWRLQFLAEGKTRPANLMEVSGYLPLDLVPDPDGRRLGILIPRIAFPGSEEGLSMIWVDLVDGTTLSEPLADRGVLAARVQELDQVAIIRPREEFRVRWIRLRGLEEGVRVLYGSEPGGNR